MTTPLSSHLNRVLGPWLLRFGITVRSKVAALSGKPATDNFLLDHLLLMPFATKLISIEVHHMAAVAVEQAEAKKSPSWKAYATNIMDGFLGRKRDETVKDEVQTVKLAQQQQPTTNIKLEILEKYLRPVLVPYEQWSDVLRWRSMSQLKNWVRAEFLIAKYGADVGEALVAYPQLRLSPQIRPMKYYKQQLLKLLRMLPDGIEERRTSLPSSAIVVKAFLLEQWNTQKDARAQLSRITRLCTQLGGEVFLREGFPCAQLPPDTDLSSVSLEDLLELVMGQIVGCGPLNALCEDAGIYQLWTKEYISGLALYLRKRCEKYPGKTMVLDVGAGDGVLAKALLDAWHGKEKRFTSTNNTNTNTSMDSGRKIPTIVAIDNGSWSIRPTAPVEKLNVQAALTKYCSDPKQQVVVLCSWMPCGEDWSCFFRQANVDEYILIGEYDNGTCGDNWATWGNPEFCAITGDDESDDESSSSKAQPKPYAHDGYQRQELDKLVPFQFSRLDTAFSRSSSTVSFKRASTNKA